VHKNIFLAMSKNHTCTSVGSKGEMRRREEESIIFFIMSFRYVLRTQSQNIRTVVSHIAVGFESYLVNHSIRATTELLGEVMCNFCQ
jgi:hypothetical protein